MLIIKMISIPYKLKTLIDTILNPHGSKSWEKTL
jgi:hypothetical protein